MPPLPTGTVTFLLTDIEGSTRLWDAEPTAMAAALARHDELIAAAVAAHEGALLKTRGEGDSTFSVFQHAGAAVAAALELSVAMSSEPWPEETTLRVRVAVHTGQAESRSGDYFGAVVNRAARIRGVAHGGQILLSEAASEVAVESMPPEGSLRDLGLHRLRDLARPERLHQLLHPRLVADFPPLHSLDDRSHNLPISMTTFVGRDREHVEVIKLLAANRLVTITGLGGAGKTRLALQLAAETAVGMHDGVWLVELAPLADEAFVVAAVAAAVAVREQPGRPLLESLLDDLTGKNLLIVLDNCEHLVDAVADLAEKILTRAAGVRILATSRQPLGVRGEVGYVLRPLGLPDNDDLVTAESVEEFDALRLFADRAALVRPDFALDDPTGIARICRRLDGVPLAIELAAARMGLMTVAQLVARLDDRFPLLSTGSRTADARQQTLRGAIDWSYDLLEPIEQALFRRLSVFAGSASLDAVESVCGPCLVTLGQLVEKSLVLADDGRFRMLETMRAYASEKLQEADERYDAMTALLRWARAEAEAAAEDLLVLDAEHDNIRSALGWALHEGKDPAEGALLADTMARFWDKRGHWTEGRQWLDLAVDASPLVRTKVDLILKSVHLAINQADFAAARTAAERAAALAHEELSWGQLAHAHGRIGDIAFVGGDHAAALDHFALAVKNAKRVGNVEVAARNVAAQGMVAQARGELDEAERLFREALAAFRDGVSPDLERAVEAYLGRVLRAKGDYAGARQVAEATLASLRAGDDARMLAYALEEVSKLAAIQGSMGEALASAGEAAEIRRRLGDPLLLASSLLNVGVMQQRAEDDAAATDVLEESFALFTDLDLAAGQMSVRLELATIAMRAGDYAGARDHQLAAADLALAEDAPASHLEVLEEMALWVAAAGPTEEAVRALGVAAGRRVATGAVQMPWDQERHGAAMAQLRGAVSAAEFDLAWSAGTGDEPAEAVRRIRDVIARAAAAGR